MNTLQRSLLIAFLVVALAAIGPFGLLLGLGAWDQIRRTDEQSYLEQNQRIQSGISRYYSESGSWTGVENIVNYVASTEQRHIIVTDNRSYVVADSEDALTGQFYRPADGGMALFARQSPRSGPGGLPPRYPAAPADNATTAATTGRPLPVRPSEGGVPAPGERVGTLYLLNQPVNALFQDLSGRLLLYIVISAAVAAACALALTLWFSRRLAAPIRKLSLAAEKVGRGDLTQRIDIREQGELGQLAKNFNTMTAELEKSEQAKKYMIADAAHELRTPLSNILGYLEAVKDGVAEPDARTIEILTSEAQSLNHIVSDLQMLSLAEAGQLKLDIQPEDPAEMSRTVADALLISALAKDLMLTLDVPQGLPRVKADGQRIRQVLRNLVGNAIEHTPEGGQVTVSAHPEGALVRFLVRDTGEGIPAEDLPLIFERYYRVDKARNRRTGGTGLGLTIARQMVEMHQGTIGVESTPGQGSTFWFTLPIA